MQKDVNGDIGEFFKWRDELLDFRQDELFCQCKFRAKNCILLSRNSKIG
jgi:hypothetical protein